MKGYKGYTRVLNFSVLAVWFLLTACGPATSGGIRGMSRASSPIGTTVPDTPPTSVSPVPTLYLFGGEDHKTALGCLTCSKFDVNSVLNEYGMHGSQYSVDSIWNKYSEFGSRYSIYGVCNPYASDPPVIVDLNGNYYGRLTTNQYSLEWGIGRQFLTWLTEKVCAD